MTNKKISNKRKLLRERYGLTLDDWKNICQFYGNKCLRCVKLFNYIDLSVDHVNPKVNNGKNLFSNYQPLCLDCNRKKALRNIDYRWDKGKELIRFLSNLDHRVEQLSLISPSENIDVNKDIKPYHHQFCLDAKFLPNPSDIFDKMDPEMFRKFIELAYYEKDDDIFAERIFELLAEDPVIATEFYRLVIDLINLGFKPDDN